MVIEIFDDKIAVPSKCGSRYFSKATMSPENKTKYLSKVTSSLPHSKVELSKEMSNQWKKIEWLVVREPIEHLMSALHTDLVSCWRDDDKIQLTLNDYVSEWGQTLFHAYFYSELEKLMHRLKINIKPIHISDITEFLKNMGWDIPYKKIEYSFIDKPDWISKEDLIELIKMKFPKEWSKLIELCEIDSVYYNKFLNGELYKVSLI